ncbi:MAG TPA: LysR family transcriptional regulator, partial [Burkholderiales bacterium]|nr:LysR family transcriptional regulator [Burkholderiales bacterium]
MKLQQLRYLCAIVDESLSITRAASKLHTSQPGVSKQLKLLEDELMTPLLVRQR